jgi:ankyrin repeat domain-containing protein 50
LIDQFQADPKIAVAYFYFDFNDKEKQKAEDLLSSLLAQLASQSSRHVPKTLKDLYTGCKDIADGKKLPPTFDGMYGTFVSLVSEFDQVYICLDALDECDDRKRLLDLLNRIPRKELTHLHILATSRREWDLEPLAEMCTKSVDIPGSVVDADIRLYIEDQLNKDRVLKKRPKLVKEKIMEALIKDAKGMYDDIAFISIYADLANS